MKNILITGATGLIGGKLIPLLQQRGYQLSILSRSARTIEGVKTYIWDIEKGILPQEAVDNADCIVHLAGANVGDKKWTSERKQEIINSRVKSGDLLLDKIKKSNHKPEAFISASAVGYYGLMTSNTIFTEQDDSADDFFGTIGKAWESVLKETEQLDIRSVALRIGVVLAKEDGALPKMMTSLKFGFGTPIGNGEQFVPWIHLDDIVAIFLKAIEDASVHGVYNAVAPQHTTNKELMKTLCKAKKRLFIPIGVPSFLLKLFLGDMADIVLKGSRASANKILKTGFAFSYPNLLKALQNLIR